MGVLMLVLLVLAFVSFVLAAGQAQWPKANLIGLGLALWILVELIARFQHLGGGTP